MEANSAASAVPDRPPCGVGSTVCTCASYGIVSERNGGDDGPDKGSQENLAQLRLDDLIDIGHDLVPCTEKPPQKVATSYTVHSSIIRWQSASFGRWISEGRLVRASISAFFFAESLLGTDRFSHIIIKAHVVLISAHVQRSRRSTTSPNSRRST